MVEELEKWIAATTAGEDILSEKLGDLTVESVTPLTMENVEHMSARR